MNPKALQWLICPLCGSDLHLDGAAQPGTDVQRGAVMCASGHAFPVVAGVPRLLIDARLETTDDARSIQESFSREWSHFDYDGDRTWGGTGEQRRDEFLRQVALPAEALEGRVVLDAGCGNGVLSTAISTLGCDVVATDIGHQVQEAQRHLGARPGARAYYVQADVMRPPFRPGAFDVVFCAGVLHHTPSTRGSFDKVARAVAPGGTMFVWLYWNVPGRLLRAKAWMRRGISRLPGRLQHGVVMALLPQAMVRQWIRTARGQNPAKERLTPRERLVVLLDSYTPRYRWEHTPEEVHAWFQDIGFVDARTTERGTWGFGVAARRPATPAAAPLLATSAREPQRA